MELSARMVARHWLVADMVLHLSSRQLAAAFDSWQVSVRSGQEQRCSGSTGDCSYVALESEGQNSV